MIKQFNDASLYSELAIFECGNEECIKEKVIVLTKKTYHLLHYVYAGKGVLILNNQKYELSKGQMFYIPPNTDAVYYSDKDNPWSYNWVGFGGSRVEEYLHHLNIDLNHPIINDIERKYRPIFNKIVSRYIDIGFSDLSALGALYQFFGEMIFDLDDKSEFSNSKITIQLAKDFIHNNYQFDISVIDIAKNANVTPNYLSYLFQKEEGMSTKTYLIKVRMEKAMALILTSDFKLKEIAKMVGYPNQLHFSNQFKAYYGHSPRFYRNKKEN